MSFREKLTLMLIDYPPDISPMASVVQLEDAVRLHEEEMAEKDTTIRCLRGARDLANDAASRLTRENSQLREQLSETTSELALADKEIAMLRGALNIKTEECRQMERLLGEKTAKFNVCRSEALSTSSQREEAKECDPLHAPCECHCAYPFCGQRMPCRTHSEVKE